MCFQFHGAHDPVHCVDTSAATRPNGDEYDTRWQHMRVFCDVSGACECSCVCAVDRTNIFLFLRKQCDDGHEHTLEWTGLAVKVLISVIASRLMHSSLNVSLGYPMTSPNRFRFSLSTVNVNRELEFQISPNPTARVMCWHWNEPAYSRSQWNGR